MYKCLHCGELFDEPENKRYELCRIDGQSQWAYDHVCPICGCCEFEPVERCVACGEYFSGDQFEDTDEYPHICKTCYHGKSAVVVA